MTGERYQVEVPLSSSQPADKQYPSGVKLSQASQFLPGMTQCTPQTVGQSAVPPVPLPTSHGQVPQHAQGHLLQDRIQGIVRINEGGVTKLPVKPIDFAKQCPAKWAKKATIESINLPLFTYGSISELEASLSGRSAPLSAGDFLAKVRHIRNYLEVCCLNAEPTDFKSYGWSIAKDYALKVENGVEHQLKSWEGMSGGVQTDQLVLAQMDCPRPNQPLKKAATGGRDSDLKSSTTTRERCRSYNTCKSEDKCDYELAHPDRKCILKHECTWCKTNLKISHKHQEWACKKKN